MASSPPSETDCSSLPQPSESLDSMLSEREELAMAAARCEARLHASVADIARTSSQLALLDAQIAERKRLGGTYQLITFAPGHDVDMEVHTASNGPVLSTPSRSIVEVVVPKPRVPRKRHLAPDIRELSPDASDDDGVAPSRRRVYELSHDAQEFAPEETDQEEAPVKKRRKLHSHGAPCTRKASRRPLSRREAPEPSALRLPTPPATDSRKRRKVDVTDPEVVEIPPPTPPASSPTPVASKKAVPVTPTPLPSNAPRPPVGARLLSPPRFEVMRAPTTPPRPATQPLRSLKPMGRKRATAASGSNTIPPSLISSGAVTVTDAEVYAAAPAPVKKPKTSKKLWLQPNLVTPASTSSATPLTAVAVATSSVTPPAVASTTTSSAAPHVMQELKKKRKRKRDHARLKTEVDVPPPVPPVPEVVPLRFYANAGVTR